MNVDSTEPREPSYYEVALTNRQVLVAFVVLLTCLLAAFLSGVWIGRGHAPARAVASAPQTAPTPSEPIEKLTFFASKQPVTSGGAQEDAAPAESGKKKPAATKPAAPATAPAAPDATETMRRTLEAEMDAHRESAEPAPSTAGSAPAEAAPVAGTRTRRARPSEPETAPPASETRTSASAPAPPATAPATNATGGFWIQVYSSTNSVHAREIAARLRKAGFKVVLADFEKDGQTQTRVRVGPYPSREKADPVAARLRREQRLDTWVTDSP
jgi:cell division septation protein DedD